jgi:hypothetical protein
MNTFTYVVSRRPVTAEDSGTGVGFSPSCFVCRVSIISEGAIYRRMVTLAFQVAECSVIVGGISGMYLMCYAFENNLLIAGGGAFLIKKNKLKQIKKTF